MSGSNRHRIAHTIRKTPPRNYRVFFYCARAEWRLAAAPLVLRDKPKGRKITQAKTERDGEEEETQTRRKRRRLAFRAAARRRQGPSLVPRQSRGDSVTGPPSSRGCGACCAGHPSAKTTTDAAERERRGRNGLCGGKRDTSGCGSRQTSVRWGCPWCCYESGGVQSLTGSALVRFRPQLQLFSRGGMQKREMPCAVQSQCALRNPRWL